MILLLSQQRRKLPSPAFSLQLLPIGKSHFTRGLRAGWYERVQVATKQKEELPPGTNPESIFFSFYSIP